MTRIKIAGLCLIAVFALGAFAASSAFGAVEYGRCVKTAKINKAYHGRYKDTECLAAEEATASEQANGGSANKYDWQPGPSSDGNFTIKGKASTFELPSTGGKISCKNNEGLGQLKNAEAGNAELNFKGCSYTNQEVKFTCQNKGASAGEIRTEKLATLTYGHGEGKALGAKEPAAGEVWTAFTPKKEGSTLLAEFECEGTVYKVTGYINAEQASEKLNAMEKAGTATFEPALVEQGMFAEYTDQSTGKVETGVVIKLSAVESIKYASKIEIRS